MSQEKAFKYGIAARRYLIRQRLGWMGRAMTKRDAQARERLFLQARRSAASFATPALEAHPELYDALEDLPRTEDDRAAAYAGVHHPGWVRACTWVEAWYRDDVFGAKPRDDQIEADDLLEPNAEQATHYFAQRAYREAVVDTLQVQAEALTEPDGAWANALYDWTYPYIVAIAWPVLTRLEDTHDRVRRIWQDGLPPKDEHARARRLETVDELVLAWHQSGVFSEATVPHDDAARDDLLELIASDTHPLDHLED